MPLLNYYILDRGRAQENNKYEEENTGQKITSYI